MVTRNIVTPPTKWFYFSLRRHRSMMFFLSFIHSFIHFSFFFLTNVISFLRIIRITIVSRSILQDLTAAAEKRQKFVFGLNLENDTTPWSCRWIFFFLFTTKKKGRKRKQEEKGFTTRDWDRNPIRSNPIQSNPDSLAYTIRNTYIIIRSRK